ncbi:MAG: hypothetical protein GY787_19480 [Alteromonadales bacterium]|nr:hypothetical protein [Alteromonadales bacterium]MCP4989259.1 hypothetical protein [Colwellia sp.]
MSDDNAKVNLESVEEIVTYRHGFIFEFVENGRDIKVHCLSVSGKESIYIDKASNQI